MNSSTIDTCLVFVSILTLSIESTITWYLLLYLSLDLPIRVIIYKINYKRCNSCFYMRGGKCICDDRDGQPVKRIYGEREVIAARGVILFFFILLKIQLVS